MTWQCSITFGQIDELVAEYGEPVYLQTDDGEQSYWKFRCAELPVADNLGELFVAALQMGLVK